MGKGNGEKPGRWSHLCQQGLHGVRALCTAQCQPPGPGWLLAFMGRLGSGAELGRKVAKGLSLVFWCLKLVNKVGKGFFFQLVPVLVLWEQPKCLAARGKVARRQAHT